MLRLKVVLAVLWVVGVLPIHLRAQSSARWEFGVNAARVSYDTLRTLDAPSALGLVEWRGGALLGRLSGGVAGFQDAGWTVYGGGDVTGWLTPSPDHPLHVEWSGSAAGSRYSSGFDSYLLRSDVRLHWMGPRAGGWAGLGGARSRNSSDDSAVGAVIPGAGLWGRMGPGRITLGYQAPTLLGERVHEVASALVVSLDPLDLALFGGWKGAPGDLAGPGVGWGGGTLSLWVGSSVALTLSGGRDGGDALQGLPGSDFVSVGLRWTRRRERPVPEIARAPMLFGSESASAGTIGFTVGGARSVEVAGDWNGWLPEPLLRAPDGRWLLPPGLPPGIYHFNLRVDGMRWIVPDGVPVADDGFGGQVGILIVRDGA